MTSCIVEKKIRAIWPGPLELFPFVVLAILMAMAEGISEHMLTSWSSFFCFFPFIPVPLSAQSLSLISSTISSVSSLPVWEMTQNEPQGLTCH